MGATMGIILRVSKWNSSSAEVQSIATNDGGPETQVSERRTGRFRTGHEQETERWERHWKWQSGTPPLPAAEHCSQ